MQYYMKITKEKPLVTSNGTSSGGYNSGAMDAPVVGSDYIWVDYGTNAPPVNQVFTNWNHQSVVPNRGVTNRLTGAEQYQIGGSIQTLLFHEQADFWRMAVLEPTVAEEDNPYFVQDLPSYQIDRWVVVNGNATWTDRITGCKFTSASLMCSSEGSRAPVQMTVNWAGSTRVEIPSAPAFTAPLCDSWPVKPYRWNKSTLTLDSGGAKPIVMDNILRSWQLDIQHQMATRINKGATVTNMVQTGWAPRLSAVWDTDSWAFKTRYQDIIKGQSSVEYDKSTLVLLDTVAAPAKAGNTTFSFANLVIRSLADNLPVADFSTQNAVLEPFFDCTDWDMKVAYLAVGA